LAGLCAIPAAPTCGLANLYFGPIRPHFSPILSVLSNTCGPSPRRRFRITQAISRRCGTRRFACFVSGLQKACPKTGIRRRLSNRESTAVSRTPHKQRPKRDPPGSLPDTRFQGREAFPERISFRGRHDSKPALYSATAKGPQDSKMPEARRALPASRARVISVGGDGYANPSALRCSSQSWERTLISFM